MMNKYVGINRAAPVTQETVLMIGSQRRNRAPRLALACLMLLAAASTALADIYSYVDKNGVLHFTNVPTSPKYRVYMREYPVQRSYATLTAGYGKSSLVTIPGTSRFSDQYDHLINEASQLHGVDFPLLKAVIKAESNFNPQAVSSKGALGLMQLMPENVRLLSVRNPFDPRDNIMGGACFLKRQIDRFGDYSLALAAYNAGPELVDRYRSIPPIEETTTYVRRVMSYYQHLRQTP
jgi:soluble lytic murein transglycosylase